MHVRICLVMLVAGLIVGDALRAAGQAKGAKAVAKDPSADFDKLFAEWKQVLADLRKKNLEYRASKDEDKEKLLEERDAIIERGDALEPKVCKAAEAAFLAAPGKNKVAEDLLLQIADDSVTRENYEEALRLAKFLIDNGSENKAIYAAAAQAAVNANEFETAVKYFKLAKEAGVLSPTVGDQQIAITEEFMPKWKKEQAIRAAEAKADDLPRVKITTNKGDIVLELFENEAPNTVANFIALVEKGAYDGTPFHRVLKGFVAQGGDPKGNGTGGPGYTIPCECYAENHRLHFRGSLSMAHAGRDTGGSQFFLTFVPTPDLDGRHTVFGRIVDGLDVLAKLQKRDPDLPNPPEPDKIVSAEVLRKRNHDYTPEKVPEKKPSAPAKK